MQTERCLPHPVSLEGNTGNENLLCSKSLPAQFEKQWAAQLTGLSVKFAMAASAGF